MHKYQQKIWTKQSPRDKMIRNRTFGVTPVASLIQRKVTNALSGGLNALGKLLSCIGEYEGLRLGLICKDATWLRQLCVKVCIRVAKIQHSKKNIAQSTKVVL